MNRTMRAGVLVAVSSLLPRSLPAQDVSPPPAETALGVTPAAASGRPPIVEPTEGVPGAAVPRVSSIPPDLIRFSNGAFLRVTIVELVPDDHVIFVTAGGETRRLPADEFTYAGPATVYKPPPPAPRPPPRPLPPATVSSMPAPAPASASRTRESPPARPRRIGEGHHPRLMDLERERETHEPGMLRATPDERRTAPRERISIQFSATPMEGEQFTLFRVAGTSSELIHEPGHYYTTVDSQGRRQREYQGGGIRLERHTHYERLCTAPCTTEVHRRGDRFGVRLGNGPLAAADGVGILAEGDTLVLDEYDDMSGVRAGGWVVMIAGVALGGLMMLNTTSGEGSDLGTLGVGIGLASAGALIGGLMTGTENSARLVKR